MGSFYSSLLIILAAVFVINIIGYSYSLWASNRGAAKRVKVQWGKPPKEAYKSDDFASISNYFRNIRSLENKDTLIDEITWNDLDMESVFKKINNTHTSVGEEYLYSLLRDPLLNKSKLEERGKLIDYFQTNKEERKKLQFVLELLGKQRHANISDYLGEFSYLTLGHERLFKILALLPLAFIILTFFAPPLGLALLFLSLIINATIYYKTRARLEMQMYTIGYATRFIRTTGRLLKLESKAIADYKPGIQKCYNALKKIGRLAVIFASYEGDFLADYLKITFLVQVRNYNTILNLLKANQDHFRELYETIGFIDSMISIASYRQTLSYYAEPELKERDNQELIIKAIDIYHPLLASPVSNTLELRQSLLITGSNASGKSTFLKTLALNAILSQTIYTSLAREYTSDMFCIMSSMALKDNLYNNESYFVAEVKSLRRILDRLNDQVPCLCFIDEILRGTNTIERIAASSRVLDLLSRSNCISIAATHDVELTKILESTYRNCHFQEEIIGDEILFDYKLYEGNAKSRNAIKLLSLMGFAKEIVNNAEAAAHEFEAEGVWRTIEE